MISLFLAVALTADPSPLPTPPVPVVYVTLREVVQIPTAADFQALQPRDRLKGPQFASVPLDCAVLPDGRLDDCRVGFRTEPTPEAATATRAIAGFYRLRPLTGEGLQALPPGTVRRFRTTISWMPGRYGVDGVPLLPLPPSKTGGPRITQPDWVRRPSPDDMAKLYPPAARKALVAASVTMSCRVRGDGLLESCQVLMEEPPGYGFGEITLKLAPRFKMKPLTREGEPVEGMSVRIPLRWSLPD